MGIGGIVSNAGSGWLLEHVGPNAPYVVGGVGALAIGSLVFWILPSPEATPILSTDRDPPDLASTGFS